jgi:hypothetical protein
MANTPLTVGQAASSAICWQPMVHFYSINNSEMQYACSMEENLVRSLSWNGWFVYFTVKI